MAAVLAKVQKEVGPSAKISSAQKVRTGGMGGFFQREKYEVLVEVPDAGETVAAAPAAPAAPAASTDTPASLLDLANKVNDEEDAPAPAAPSAAPSPVSAPPAVAENTDKVDNTPHISTESDSFAEILNRIAYQSNLTSQPDEDEDDEEYVDDYVVEDEEEDEDEWVGGEPAHEVVKPVIADRPAFLDVPKPTAADRVIDVRPNAVPAVRTRITDSPLAALGLPVPYIPQLPETTKSQVIQKALAGALESLPKAPVVKPGRGSIIAVVGSREEALQLAGDLAHKWGRPKEEVVLASQAYRGKGSANVLRNVRNAEDSRRSWSRRSRPTIVAIEAHMGPKATVWAEHILEALEPIATYGTVDATRKAEDIAAWSNALGGIDCLAVNNVDETVSPAAVLATGIPVERIDGRKATPGYWAALLTERLSAA